MFLKLRSAGSGYPMIVNFKTVDIVRPHEQTGTLIFQSGESGHIHVRETVAEIEQKISENPSLDVT